MRTRSARRPLPCAWIAALVGLVGFSAIAPSAIAAPDLIAPAPAAPAPAAPGPAKPAPQSAKAPAKPPAKPKAKPAKQAAKPAKKSAPRKTRKPGEPGAPDEGARRIISGAAAQPGQSTRESPELRAMREIDLALFPPATPAPAAWAADGTLLLDLGEPRVDASGVPPSALLPAPGDVSARPAAAAAPDPARDISWLRQLEMPDIPVRWDARVVRYLEYYKNDPRGRTAAVLFLKKSGRYGAAIRRVLREQKLPEDIVWLSLIESGFDPTIQSPVGAAGLWQFMPEGARIYGLTVDRWIDERLDPERSTVAAARYLADLRQRFGNWELAFAAYNMGYGGLLAAIRKYNTNDFWELARLEAGLPLETALYVPKIISIAIVARNRKVFGVEDIELEPAATFDKVAVGSGVSLQAVATASGVTTADIEALNPQLIARRTPPQPLDFKEQARWEIRVPPGAGARTAKAIPAVLDREPKLERYRVRWGESLEDIAGLRGVTRYSLQTLNGLRSGEGVRPGALLFVPAANSASDSLSTPALAPALPTAARPVITVPAQRFTYDDRRRVFYRVVPGDTVREVAAVLGVGADELCRWNTLDAGAVLQEGMTLQAYIPRAKRHQGVLLLEEADARVLEVGTEAFFAHFEALKGRKRLEIVAREGDDWRKLSKRYALSLGMLERINHRSRRSTIEPGEKVVVYVPIDRPADAPPAEPSGETDIAVASAGAAAPPDALPGALPDASPDVPLDAPAAAPPSTPAVATQQEATLQPAVLRRATPETRQDKDKDKDKDKDTRPQAQQAAPENTPARLPEKMPEKPPEKPNEPATRPARLEQPVKTPAKADTPPRTGDRPAPVVSESAKAPPEKPTK